MNVKEILVETTGGEFHPHTYYLGDEGKLVAFKAQGTDTLKIFKKPLSFSKRGRTFHKLKAV